MNTKKTLLYAVILVFIIASASFLYGYLSENFSSDRISVIEEQGETTKTETNESADNSEPTDAESEEAQNSTLAPDFTVVDNNGNKVSLSDKFGKPVIVNFWASWCPPCKSEMPDFEEAYKKYGSDITFMMVNMIGGRETLETAKAFIEDAGYTFPVYYDTEYEAAMTYGASSIPMTFFIDKDGNLTAYAQGMIDKENLDVGIGMIYDTYAQAEKFEKVY